jgi:hypothetical protein
MRSQFILAFAGSLVFTAAAVGQNWINPAGGSWGVPGDWSNDGTPFAPVFDLNSPAPGYTTSLPSQYFFGNPIIVQSDNVTVDLNGYSLGASALNVATTTGQTGSLALVGPGTISLTNFMTNKSSLDVGDQGGTGQLTINDATLEFGSELGQTFDANGLVVENGAEITMGAGPGFFAAISNATFNDGTFQGAYGASLGLNQVTLTNGSIIGGYNVGVGNASLDHSSISGYNSTSVSGTVTLSDDSTLIDPYISINGTVFVNAGCVFGGAAQMDMENGTISVELNGQVSEPITRPTTLNNGTLDFTLQNGFVPTIGEQFDVFNSGPSYSPDPDENGTFATVNLPQLPNGESWDISDLYTTDTIMVVPEPTSIGIIAIGTAGLALRRHRKSAYASA